MMEEVKKEQMNLDQVDQMVQGKEVDPETQAQIDAYIMTLMQVIHSDETGGSMVELLKAAPPEQSVPQAALEANGLVENIMSKKGKKPKDEVKMAGMIYLTADLVELGNAANAWEQPVPEDQVVPLFQNTLQKYIHKGLKDGSIDPIELQAQTEPLLNEKQMSIGAQSASALGLPASPTAEMGIDAYAQKKRAPLEKENAKLKSLLAQKGGQPQ
jgi:hypothetical protein